MRKGSKHTPLTLERLRTSHLGQIAWNKGIPHTKEHKAKLKVARNTSKFQVRNWVADRSKLKMARKQAYDSRYKDWMLNVKNRDGWKCKISNSKCSGRLESHHILGWESHPELRYELNNGITLCLYHHPRQRAKEVELSPYFQELVLKANLI